MENKRLIDANEAYEIARASGRHNDFARSRADLTSLQEVLEDCTTVDAVEVVHGHWVDDYPYVRCSVCNAEWINCRTDNEPKLFYFCPNCGAKMDGGTEDG